LLLFVQPHVVIVMVVFGGAFGQSGRSAVSYVTPHQPNHNNIPAITNTIMSKPKIVVTRQLIDKAQRLLDEKKDELEILQWNSEKVRLANIP
jgi:hypothetical protein